MLNLQIAHKKAQLTEYLTLFKPEDFGYFGRGPGTMFNSG